MCIRDRHVALASGQVLLVQVSGRSTYRMGDRVTLSLSAANAHYFDANGQRISVPDA
jgi:hypothetical protein